SDINNFTLAGAIDVDYRTAMRVMGLISVSISLILIYLITCKTPLASRYRANCVAVQLCFLLFDVHWCFLFVPLLPLPYFAVYCTGLMCSTLKVDVHYHMIFMLLMATETFAWFFICMLQRHQALIPMNSNCHCSLVLFKYGFLMVGREI
ncbi:hypothetical protein PENTCL1PPCAC_4488, partial [Pristionchus entomophagus]